jgi:hypothetical protein
MEHLTTEALEAGLDEIRRSPADEGRVELIVARPAVGERDELTEAELDVTLGLVGDTWSIRPSSTSEDGRAHPEMQLNMINTRAIALISGEPARWVLAGDQLYVDLDLSTSNLPPGTRLALGSAVIEVTAQPHRGCAKFAERFGLDAARWVNSPAGRELNLRGINAKVVTPGTIRVGDVARKVT